MLQLHSFTFSPISENTYLLYNEHKQAIIVDPGCYADDEKEKLSNFIALHKLDVQYLLNTHCHLDHVFGNLYVSEKYKLHVHCHKNEVPVLAYAPTSGLHWGLPFDNYQGPLIHIDEGDTIQLGDDQLKVLFTPGHSPGSISFYCQEQQFIISGDVLFRNSIGRTDLTGGNMEVLLTSIRQKLFTLPPDTQVYSGHGPVTTIGYEMRNNPFLKFF
jgi:glyoxylase-like metal-dependent hydrolase (beta-lactamase superfamily II)